MKKLLVGFVLTSSLAQAQTSATSTSAAAAAPAPTAAAPAVETPAAQTSINNLGAMAPSRFGGVFYVETSRSMRALETLTVVDADGNSITKDEDMKERTPIATLWTAGIKYKATDKASFELWQHAWTRSNVENLSPGERNIHGEGQQQMMDDTVVKANYKTDFAVLGSKPLTVGGRYYLPTSRSSRLMKKTNGTLRFDTTLSWDLTTKMSFDYAISPRISLNSAQASSGSDAIYRMVQMPSLSYNFNDNYSLYSGVTFDTRSKDLGRGTWVADKGNIATPEVGGSITYGWLNINPAITSDIDMAKGDGSNEFFKNESRIFAAENTTYNLNFYATF